MQNDTKIYVSKKAALIVESIRDHSKEGNGSQKYNGNARKFTVEFIDGTTYESNNSLHVQNHIKDKYDEDGKAMLEEREAELKREKEAAIAARAAAITAEAEKKTAVDKVKYSESNTKKNADEKEKRQRELKRERDRRYRQRNLEAVRQRDREYRRKKRAEEKASK